MPTSSLQLCRTCKYSALCIQHQITPALPDIARRTFIVHETLMSFDPIRTDRYAAVREACEAHMLCIPFEQRYRDDGTGAHRFVRGPIR